MKKDYSLVLNRPRITEKAGIKAESQNVYTFEINPEVTKQDVKKAVIEFYKVTPLKVNITKLPTKNIISRGKSGKRSGVKKAVVYLKKGEKIEFI